MGLPMFDLPENYLANFDTDLQEFYHSALRKELDLSNTANATGVKKALKDVVHAYKKDTVETNSSKIIYDSSAKRCAYVLKHCPCFSSAVAKHFSLLLRKNPNILEKTFHRGTINLCCLGGGPGTEAVAIIKILNTLFTPFLFGKRKIELRIRIVDLSETWKKTAELILKAAQQIPAMCDTEKINLSFELVKADLTEPFGEEVRKCVFEADVITMVYFVSAVNGSKAQNKCIPMLQNIMTFAKPGTLLFFLDSAKDIHYDAMMMAANSFKNMQQNYGPIVQEFHTLSMKSIKKHMELYFAHFNAYLCLTNCFITTAGWSKEDVRSVPRNIFQEDRPSLRMIKRSRSWSKKVEYNTRRMEIYQQRVERLILSELNMDFVTDDLEESDTVMDLDCLFYDKKTFFASKAKHKRIILSLE